MTIMSATKRAALLVLVLALLPPVSGMTAESDDAPVEVVVTGRQPGPPLWKVSNGDKVLWIFPYLSWIPQGMIWESERVARVIAQSQEFLSLPEARWLPPKAVMLNPVNLARAIHRSRDADRNPDGGTLEENLPPELYVRFAVLKARYFPANDGPLEMRPLFAGRTMISNIRKQQGLVSGDDMLKTIQRLVRRNRGIERTDISVTLQLGGDFNDYATSMDAVYGSFPPEQEQACFAQQLRHVEEDLDEVKHSANSWAQGYIDEFRNVDEFHNVSTWAVDELNACADLFRGTASPEHEALAGMAEDVNRMWLDAAENALATNASTFAILPINELLAEDGLLSRLKATGYEVTEL
jgi:hypothetical protein